MNAGSLLTRLQSSVAIIIIIITAVTATTEGCSWQKEVLIEYELGIEKGEHFLKRLEKYSSQATNHRKIR